MSLFRSFAIAFSTYSKIPMPIFEWKEKDMKWVLIFFPWVGAVVGAAYWLWGYFTGADFLALNSIARVLVLAAIPVLITGGFHVDGFLDTMDAVHSYAPREKKLEILKDPHIGAFGVIMAILFAVIDVAAMSVVAEGIDAYGNEVLLCFAGVFILSRIFSGFSVLHFPKAKKEGSLNTIGDNARNRIVTISLVIELIIVVALELFISLIFGAVVTGTVLLVFLYYYFKSKKVFGGTTGDLAGYFVTLSEIMAAITVAIAVLIMRFV